ncbi:fatty-acid--AMP ligase FAAL21/FadD21 [Mycobacterium intracellulare]|uniref:fatty-acid--AMP ligase FAAL21/FadD21 n=1 Tax=Mycobacterium intracellulare TaxID=1767 RepID=UPI000452F9B0|nr:fatty-acid--AMP ligase FAAL21/FadD21 [Mycobacterium intracellulare]AOS91294.1 acyl-CoA synthetase [Mycobacterium intracellulare subsp. chimaera]ARV81307.1 acyl-CoA synthetase [Mycobacterium intracellulare subsp. chimaera]ASL08345.1 acyl-CoA synthetase [Mycobacterium intracellulare subsp. chimaera]ASL20130.1 acyl-CoA synthetase [Mycobacterium intracellulare subsp. chimaera]ETZ34181.1 putative fatty-acid--CoA ligase fadD21 [Mycobacterium intracellulare MIN_052511_1280]
MQHTSVVSLLRERAGLQPDDLAFRYTDYEQDWAGVTESLTWAQLYRRTLNVAHEVTRHASSGERAVILAPQGLPYIVAFLGAMQAGLIAVPLMVPQPGTHDERVSAVLADTGPAVVLTTSTAAAAVDEYLQRPHGATPAVIEVDSLSLDDPNPPGIRVGDAPSIAYLQYTSGSTRLPAGVMVSHRNLHVNFQQLMAAYFPDFNGVAPRDSVCVSWLPFYHDMGLVQGVIAPILGGYPGVLTSPVAFLQRPARWIQAMAQAVPVFSAAPNFAFELAARKSTDADLAGLDLGNIISIVSGAERIHPATLYRFCKRFAPYNFREDMMQPSYGLAEATVYVASRAQAGAPKVVHFDPEKLAQGNAQPSSTRTGSPLLSYGVPQSPTVRIVDPDTGTQCPHGTVGEIWVHGDNVADGYWQKPEETQRTFGAVLADPSPGTPGGPWLRTGDLGFLCDGELFIVGRMKDLLIVYGRNHYPEDIESTVQAITGGRVAAIAVPVDETEKLVTIIELKNRGDSGEHGQHGLDALKNDVTAAISDSHGLNVADLVLVAPGSIPTTTSGKIRRAACVERYRRQQFTRLDA